MQMLRAELSENMDSHKIGARLIISLILMGIGGFLVMALFVKTIVSARIDALEKTQIQHQAAQLSAFIEDQKNAMKTKTYGWAFWDDSYEFVEDFNQNFTNRNLEPSSLSDFGVSSISYIRIADKKSYSVAYDKTSKTEDKLLSQKMTEFLEDIIVHQRLGTSDSYETYLRIHSKLYVVGTRKVLKSDKTGNVKGIIAIARQINDDDVKATLQNDTIIDFVRTTKPINSKIYADNASISVEIFGMDEAPVGRLTTNYPRSLKAVKRDLWVVLAFGILALSCAMIIFFYGRISELVIAPLQSLNKHLAQISETGKLSIMESDLRKDEMGQVIGSFNEMIVKIGALQESLAQKSFQIGKTQSEIDVLHNVKNALSPVSTILSRLDDLPRPLSNNFTRAIDELANQEIDNERRQKLVEFVKVNLKAQDEVSMNGNRLVTKARENINKAIETIESLRTRNDHFEDEFCEITSVVDKSLEIARHSEKSVQIEFVKPPPQLVKGSKIIYSQVFDNLVTNALEAIRNAKRENGVLNIEISPIERDFERLIKIQINDNGDGFDENTKTRLFERGFSTRTNKKGGIGLHWCANNVNAMGGKLKIDSAGKQKGAQVTIEIPLAA